ncbi:glycosyltransferase family 4 protein, partial [Vibrio aestuarianus]
YVIDKPNMYGSERHLLDILSFFSKNKNDKIELVTFSDGPMLQYVKGIKSSVFPMSWLFNFAALYNLYCYIKKTSPDVIHGHQPKAIFLTALLGRALNIPTIITVHSKAYDHAIIHKNIVKRLVVYLFHKIIYFVSALCAMKVIYVNENMFESSIRKSKSAYISNWLPIKYELGRTKAFLFDKNKKIRFISVGSVTKAKGYDLLLDFLGCLEKDGIAYSSIVYGGKNNDFYSELTQHQYFSDKINFAGYGEALISAYSKADFYVLFSRSETFGLSYLEAMSQGLPIVALDLEELKGLMPSGNVLASDTESAYHSFIELLNSKNYTTVSNNNIQRSKEFSYLNRMKQLESIYCEVITRGV